VTRPRADSSFAQQHNTNGAFLAVLVVAVVSCGIVVVLVPSSLLLSPAWKCYPRLWLGLLLYFVQVSVACFFHSSQFTLPSLPTTIIQRLRRGWKKSFKEVVREVVQKGCSEGLFEEVRSFEWRYFYVSGKRWIQKHLQCSTTGHHAAATESHRWPGDGSKRRLEEEGQRGDTAMRFEEEIRRCGQRGFRRFVWSIGWSCIRHPSSINAILSAHKSKTPLSELRETGTVYRPHCKRSTHSFANKSRKTLLRAVRDWCSLQTTLKSEQSGAPCTIHSFPSCIARVSRSFGGTVGGLVIRSVGRGFAIHCPSSTIHQRHYFDTLVRQQVPKDTP
jgi:hypothetical protein